MGMAADIEKICSSVPSSDRKFAADQLTGLPTSAARYLKHAIAPGIPMASAVHLRMHGHIQLGRFLPFTAEQVINWGRGFVWRASVRMFGIPITGFDRLMDGTDPCDGNCWALSR